MKTYLPLLIPAVLGAVIDSTNPRDPEVTMDPPAPAGSLAKRWDDYPWDKPSPGAVCKREYKFLFTRLYIRIPHGQRYCDPNKHCGSGFWDNIRPHAATGWTCEPLEKDSLSISFNVPVTIPNWNIAGAIHVASENKVNIMCQKGNEHDAEVEWEANKRPWY